MKILKGTVETKKNSGMMAILVVRPDKSDLPDSQYDKTNTVEVKYVSPYGGGPAAAQVMMPERNTQILYCTAENDADQNYYYLGSIIDPQYEVLQEDAFVGPLLAPDPTKATTIRPLAMPHDDHDYAFGNQSTSYGIKTPMGNQMIIREGRDLQRDQKGIYLQTSKGHKIEMSDSKNTSMLRLAGAGERAGLEITGYDEHVMQGKSPHSAYLHASNNVDILATNGGMGLTVVDGKNIDIMNTSTGSKKTPLAPQLAAREAGNINITTAAGDIRIRSQGNGVFIDCIDNGDPATTGASFQVRSNNKIHLYSDKGIDIKSGGDVNIVGENVNIESKATGRINLNPLPPGTVSAKMGIRKTNDEIASEFISPTGQFPFFGLGPEFSTNFVENYSYGMNTDTRLTDI